MAGVTRMAGTTATQPARTTGLSWTADGRNVPSARRRLVPALRHQNRLVGWAVTVAVGALALGMRLWHLGYPHKFLFD